MKVMYEKMISRDNLPIHIALILDGNGRWAKKQGKPRTYGHLHGAKNIQTIAKEANKLGIKYLTCYCFSTENWSRPASEVKYLFSTPLKFYKRYKNKLKDSNIRVKFIGRRDRFKPEFLEAMNFFEEATKNNAGMTLVLAVDYGSKYEMVQAVKKISSDIKSNKYNIENINESLIDGSLYTKNYPPVDLLIRTSGEKRISNYLLWQAAYAEFVFEEKNWPEYGVDDFYRSIYDYQSRNRRFGGLKEDKK